MSNNITKGKLSTENHPGPAWPFFLRRACKCCSGGSSTWLCSGLCRTVVFLTVQMVQIWSCMYCFRGFNDRSKSWNSILNMMLIIWQRGRDFCLLLIAAPINTSQVQSEMLLPTQHCWRLHLPAAFYITIIHSPSFHSVVNDGQKRTMHKGLECGF